MIEPFAARIVALVVAALLFIAVPASDLRAVTLGEAAGSYSIDGSSEIAFSVGQVGGGGINGRFGRFSGTFQLNASDPSRSVVVFELYPESVTTGQQRVDEFLRSPAVFDTGRFPAVRFHSITVQQTGPETAVIDGVLTAKGKTVPARFDVSLASGDARSLSFRVTGDIFRSPFGMDVGTPIYSNVVHFDMHLHATRI